MCCSKFFASGMTKASPDDQPHVPGVPAQAERQAGEIVRREEVLVIQADERNSAALRGPRQSGFEIGDDEVGFFALEQAFEHAEEQLETPQILERLTAGASIVQPAPVGVMKSQTGDAPNPHVRVAIERSKKSKRVARSEQGDSVVLAQGLDDRPDPSGVSASLTRHAEDDVGHGFGLRRLFRAGNGSVAFA